MSYPIDDDLIEKIASTFNLSSSDTLSVLEGCNALDLIQPSPREQRGCDETFKSNYSSRSILHDSGDTRTIRTRDLTETTPTTTSTLDQIYLNACLCRGTTPHNFIRLYLSSSCLSAENRSLNDNDIHALATALKDNPHIAVLNLAGNMITSQGVIPLCNSLQWTECPVVRLDISNNPIGNSGVREILRAIRRRGSIQSALHLNFSNCRTTSGIGKVLSQGLQTLNIRRLDISQNNMRQWDCSALAQVMKKVEVQSHLELVELQASWNVFPGTCGVDLLSGILNMRSMIKLDLSWCSLGNLSSPQNNHNEHKADCILTQLLSDCITLEYINLSHNKLVEHEAFAIAKGLAQSFGTTSHLTTLLVGYNPLGFSGSAAILSALEEGGCNVNLSNLGLQNTTTSDSHRQTLWEVAQEVASLWHGSHTIDIQIEYPSKPRTLRKNGCDQQIDDSENATRFALNLLLDPGSSIPNLLSKLPSLDDDHDERYFTDDEESFGESFTQIPLSQQAHK